MLGSSSTTSTRAPPASLFTVLMLPRFPMSLLGIECGLAWFWPSREAANRSGLVDQAGGQPARLEPPDGGLAHDDGCGRGDVGVDARAGDGGGVRQGPSLGRPVAGSIMW